VWKEKQELEQNKCEKLQLGEHWVLDIFSYLLFNYVSVSALELGMVFYFLVKFCHFQTKKLGIINFSTVNLTEFANIFLNFTKLSISKTWKKKNTGWGV